MPTNPPEMRQAWIRALRHDDIDYMKVVRMCIKHFREEDIKASYKVPKGDGTFTEVPRGRPKLKKGAVPCYCPDVHPIIQQRQKLSGLACRMTQRKNCWIEQYR